MGLILGLVAAAIAAVAALNRLAPAEPRLAIGVAEQVKTGVVQAIVSGIASTICALLGIRMGRISSTLHTGRRFGTSAYDYNEQDDA